MDLVVTPAMRKVIAHFGGLGPRWGLGKEVCEVHALLYLSGRPLEMAEIGHALQLSAERVDAVTTELAEWGMARVADCRLHGTSNEPWDLLFAAMEERRQRELAPALGALKQAVDEASGDGTPRAVRQRIHALHDLVRDLAVLGGKVGQLKSRTLSRLVGVGGRVARAFGTNR